MVRVWLSVNLKRHGVDCGAFRVIAGRFTLFRVVRNRRFRRSAGFLQRVRFPAAPPEGPQIRLVSRSRTCRRRFQARASLRYIRSWRCHCGGDNPSRTCDAAKVSARAAKRPVPRRIPALSGRTSAHRATAPSAFRPRRLPRRIAPAINPQKKPRRKNPRARRLLPPHNSRCDESTCRRNDGYREEQRNQMCRSERPHIATSGPSSA